MEFLETFDSCAKPKGKRTCLIRSFRPTSRGSGLSRKGPQANPERGSRVTLHAVSPGSVHICYLQERSSLPDGKRNCRRISVTNGGVTKYSNLRISSVSRVSRIHLAYLSADRCMVRDPYAVGIICMNPKRVSTFYRGQSVNWKVDTADVDNA